MVNIDNKLKKITSLVDRGSYFTINRARQYGKTTTLEAMEKYLKNDYFVISLTLEGYDYIFETNELFCKEFITLLYNYFEINYQDNDMLDILAEASKQNSYNLLQLSKTISKLCKLSKKPIVLIIDEVDQASNHETFLRFLGMLRSKYLKRTTEKTFHSVILAGVYDIKNLKLKMNNTNDRHYNSPWNIAEDFNVDMSFSSEDISTMLIDYENDYHTNMDINKISHIIYDYTSGYPFLVSKICKVIDEQLNKDFTYNGVINAVKIIVSSQNTLFDDMLKQLDMFEELNHLIESILFNGYQYAYVLSNKIINIGTMFGFIKNYNNIVAVSNRIFEIYLYNYYLSNSQTNKLYTTASSEQKQFINNDKLDMKLILEKFVSHFNEIYNDKDMKFIEEYGRKLFLLYLRPIINGIGNYYVEARTRDNTKTDIVVDYLGEQYIIELKIWRGNSYNERGEQQLIEYLNYFHKAIGYLVSFNFNKNKISEVKEININNKTIIEAVI
jgi:hypothetical protein